MQVVHYEASEIWEMFQARKDDFETKMEIIAENPEFGVVIYLTSETRGTATFPEIVVYMDDREEYSEIVVSESDCTQTVRKIYRDYLDDDRLVDKIIEEDKAEIAEQTAMEDEIEQRDGELYDAVTDMLDIFLNEKLDRIVGYKEADEITSDVIDHLCEYLYQEHGLSVYRPMILEDEDGEEFFEEFPYDCMIFDDEEVE